MKRVRWSFRSSLRQGGRAALLLAVWMCSDGGNIAGPPQPSGLNAPDARPSSTVTAGDVSAVLVGAGNIATCSGNDDERVAAILDTVSGSIFTTGNAAYPNGTDVAYTTCFDPATTWGRHKARIRPAVGDQDYNTTGAAGYFNYFGAAAGERGSGYYSYDLGAWHIVVLNSGIAVTAGSAQEQWLRADLAANSKPCTLAYWQLPLFSSGQSGSFTKVRPLWQALYEFGADVILNGKDRDYERFALQDPNGAADPVNGIRQFVVGTGGAGNSTSFRSTILPNSEARFLAAAGVLKLTLNATSYSWVFIPWKGEVPDSGTTNCSSSNQVPTASVGGPYAGAEAGEIAFDGSASSDPDGDALTYDWDFGDGTAHGTGSAPTHAYADNGTYTVMLTVSDGKGGTATSNTTVTVTNVAPTATLAAPASVAEGGGIALGLTDGTDASATDVSAGLQYAFDCGAGAGYGEFAAAATATCPTTDDGVRTVKAQVRDKDGATTEYTAEVQVTNAAPVVETLTAPAAAVNVGAAVTVQGAFSDAGTADTHGATLDWGDGHSGPASLTGSGGSGTAGGSHTYTSAGTYTVTLIVVDDNGGSASKTAQVVVNAAPAITSLNGPFGGGEGSAIAFSATATDPDGDPVTYEWDFGDGSPRGSGASTTHAYPDEGTFIVTLVVRDGRGGSSSQSTMATVSNVAPVVGAITQPSEPMPRNHVVDLSASFTDAGIRDAHTATIDWGDGSTSAGTVLEANGSGSVAGSHLYVSSGTYTVQVTVTDNSGAVGTASRVVTITEPMNRAPTASAGGPYSGAEAQAITFNGTGSSDPDGDAITYDWDFGDGTARGSGPTPSHTYADNGTYTVTLVVTDSKGVASSAAQSTVTVSNVAPTASFDAPSSVTEGSSFTISLDGATDVPADQGGFQYAFDCGAGAGYGGFSTTNSASCQTLDNGARTVRGQVRDEDGGTREYTASVNVTNLSPVVGPVSGPSEPQVAFTVVSVAADFSDAGSVDTHTASIDWGDGRTTTATVTESGGAGSASGSHEYTAAGTYTVRVTVGDDDGGSGSSTRVVSILEPPNMPPSAVPGGPYSSTEGSSVAFNGTASSDPEGETLTYDWDFGDGSAHGSGSAPTHTYADNGTYTVRLVVTDPKGAQSAATTTATVTNVAPTATLNAPTTVVEGGAIALSLTGASDPSAADVAAGLQYAFDCGSGFGALGSGASTTCATSDDGTRTVRGRVRDKDGGTNEYTAAVTITNAEPVLGTVSGPTSPVFVGASVTVSVSFTDAGTGDTHTASIDWGDGTTTSATITEANGSGTATGSRSYASDGSYTVRITVTDDAASTWKTTTVTVVDQAPVANPGGPYAGDEGSAIAFDGSGSVDPEGDPLAWDWDWGDGTPHGSGVKPTHTYRDNGTYTVTLIVNDDRGNVSQAVSTTVTVTNVPPTATFVAPTTVDEGGPYDVAFSNPKDASPTDVVAKFQYAFDCGTGTGYGAFGSSINVHCPAGTDQGSRTVKGQIKDKDGGVTEYSATVTITNAAPVVADPTGPSGAVPGAELTVRATFTDPGKSDTHTASINWGDGVTGPGSLSESAGSGSVTGQHEYSAPGTYTIRITVTDNSGASGSNTHTLTVSQASQTVVIVGAGDIARCTLTNAEKTAKILDTIAGTVFNLGDNVYENGTLSEYQNCYGPTWGRHKSRTIPVTGNHEYNTPGASGYYQYWGAAAGDPTKGYYSLDLGDWHIVVLNSNISAAVGSPQEQWLRADLAANRKSCTIAMWHHPRFNSGPIGNKATWQPLWQALYDYDAELILVGHEHVYERMAPQTPTGVADPVRGIRQFTVGTGGAGNQSRWGTIHPNSEVRYLEDYGVLKLTLSPGGYSWNYITVSKPFSDSGTASCH